MKWFFLKLATISAELTRFSSIWVDKDLAEFYDYSEIDAVFVWGSKNDSFVDYVTSRDTEVHQTVSLSTKDEKFEAKDLTDPEVADKIINYYISEMETNKVSGFNLDYEGETYTPSTKSAYVNFLKNVTNIIHDRNGTFTVDIPWSPAELWCFNGRCYPITEIVKVVDFAVIMAYDAEEDWWGGNTWGHSTDPYYRIKQGLLEYVHCLEISPSKISIAFPWYNWKNTCADLQPYEKDKHEDRKNQCQLDMFGERSHIDYSESVEYYFDYKNRVDSHGTSSNKTFYSKVEDSFFFHWREPKSGEVFEIWMDAVPGDFSPLERRFKLMSDYGFAGLGIFSAKRLSYQNKNEEINYFTKGLWSLLTEYNAKADPKSSSQFKDDPFLTNLCRKFRDRSPIYP